MFRIHTRTALCVAATSLAVAATLPTVADASVAPPTGDAQGNLTITADGADDQIAVAAASGVFVVNGTPTTIATSPSATINVDAGAGSDTVNLGLLPAGTYGASVLSGGAGDDQISGGLARDRVVGGPGHDVLSGNPGDDVLVWNNGDGSDDVKGGAGADDLEINAAAAADQLTISKDAVNGHVLIHRSNLVPFTVDAIADTVADTVTVNGLQGDDEIAAGAGLGGLTALILSGGDGADTISAADGDDVISGGEGGDHLAGGGGNDTLDGGAGTDTIAGQEGDDTLLARDGIGDLVQGGAGDDTATVDRIDTLDGIEALDVPPPDIVSPAPTPVLVAVPSPPRTQPAPDRTVIAPRIGAPRTLSRKGRRLIATLPLSCPAGASGCAVSVIIRTGARPGRPLVDKLLGSGFVRLAAGRSTRLRIRLSSRAARLVGYGRLLTRTTLHSTDAAGDSVVRTDALVFSVPARRRGAT